MKELTAETVSESIDVGLIDCDIHIQPGRPEALRSRLPARWREHDELFGPMGPSGGAYPRARPYASRTDSWPPSGLPPGADLGFLQAQLLDAWKISYGLLNPLLNAGSQRNLDFGAALAAAINDWVAEEWLDPEPRLRGSIGVPHEDGELAAREIHRVGRDRRFAQVLLPIRTAEPLGRRKYWPMFAAAVEMDLPIGIHVGGASGWPVSGAGFHSFYFEDHSAWPAAYQTQVTSLVSEGVFERFPDLRFVLIEGGLAWMASFMWRFDDAYRRLSAEVPELRKLPSEYIRRHFWVTTQPMEEPPRKEQFSELLDQIGMNDHILFATDYPHWDFDAPDLALPAGLDGDLRRGIMAGNARRLFGFGG